MSTSANGDRAACSTQHRQHLQPLRADDDVDDVAVGLLEQRLAFLLRHAAGDRDDRLCARSPRSSTRSSPRRV